MNRPQGADDEFQLGLKLRVFNHNLDQAIRAKGWTRQQAADAMGIKLPLLFTYLSFKAYPGEDRRLTMAVALGVPLDRIFPESIEGIRLTRQPDAMSLTQGEAEELGLVAHGDRAALALDGERQDPEFAAEANERRALVLAALATLKPRERTVIEMRFGLTDGVARTQEEMGRIFGVSRTRIHQIQAKALRKLRHPSRSRALRGILS